MNKIVFLVLCLLSVTCNNPSKPSLTSDAGSGASAGADSADSKKGTTVVQKLNHGLGAMLVGRANFSRYARFVNPNPVQAQKQLGSTSSYYVKAPPVGDQLSEGSCVAWSVGYCFFSSYLQRNVPTTWSTSNEVSPAFVYHYIKLNLDCSSGSYVPWAMQLVENIGACYWKTWPYVDQACNAPIPPGAEEEGNINRSPCGDQHATKDRAVENAGKGHCDAGDAPIWTSINPTSVEDYKGFLSTYHWPLVVAFNVNQSFVNAWYSNGIWTTNFGPSIGGHSVCVIGWDDAKSYNGITGMFKCQNQWGSTEGDHGYFWVSYDLIRSGCFDEAYGWVRDEHGRKPEPKYNDQGSQQSSGRHDRAGKSN